MSEDNGTDETPEPITAHALARLLLDEPDVPVLISAGKITAAPVMPPLLTPRGVFLIPRRLSVPQDAE